MGRDSGAAGAGWDVEEIVSSSALVLGRAGGGDEAPGDASGAAASGRGADGSI